MNELESKTFTYSTDTKIHYIVRGEGPKPVVLLHGFGASMITWFEILHYFNQENYTCYLIDLKGFGKSSKNKDADYSILRQAKIVESFLSFLNLKKIILIGHSFGGSISLLLAVHKINIEKLILIDPAAFRENVRAIRFMRVPVLNYILMKCFPGRFQAKFTLRAMFHDHKKITEELTERYTDLFSTKGIAYTFIQSALQSIPARYDEIIEAYRGITVPVLILWGTHDFIIPAGYGMKLNNILKNNRLITVENCGHNPHEEDPQQTFGHIRMFLEESIQ